MYVADAGEHVAICLSARSLGLSMSCKPGARLPAEPDV